MDYKSAVEYIKSLSERGISPGLDSVSRLLSELNNPESSLKLIHIAGTNGKGSVGAYLSSIICSAGMSCARFVSPCVGDYENTFLINSESMDKNVIGKCADTLKKAVNRLEEKGIYPTSFEAETALAFLIFKHISPDYAIIECGMGGRLDATNAALKKELSIITKISLDHTAYLGSTLSEITAEKTGIIRRNTPVVTAVQDSEAMTVMEQVCENFSSNLHIADTAKLIKSDLSETVFSLDKKTYTTHMLGTYQIQNAAIAIKAAQVIGIDETAVKLGISNARWEYRFERVGNFILDGAHNPDGASALVSSLKAYTVPEKTAFVCACFADKDYEKIAEITSPYAQCVYCVTAPTNRALAANILADTFKKQGIAAYATSLYEALRAAARFDNAVVFGTLSILSDAKKIIKQLTEDDHGTLQQNL